jgi:hypothetical protein
VHLPDPIADALQGLASRIAALERTVAELSGAPADGRAAPPVQAEAEIRPLRPATGRNPAGG